MIEQAKKKNIPNVDFVVGDCEKNLKEHMVMKEKVKVTGVPETMSPFLVKHIKRFRVKRYLIVMVQKILYVYRFASLVYHKGFFCNDILKNYILLNISLGHQSLKNN